ncbi:MAG: NTP transferase domain-containing protein [Prevotella sp.]|nr:NTP transferase domain-containing protein [Prevotella sp.]
MADNKNNYCVILAGGKGRRLWPSSRDKFPKQFIDFFGVGRTQLQQTFDRFARILPKENIYINTSQDYLGFVREQLPDVPADHIMAEPIHRSTAPSVAWAMHRISMSNPEANLIVSPSDQSIFNEEAFMRNMTEGLRFVEKSDSLLTMGVSPTRAEPGYGYIQQGEYTGSDDIYKVKAFTEKPDREFARIFMESKEWYWNTGLFLSNIRYLRQCLYRFLPSVLRDVDSAGKLMSIEEEDAFMQENFPRYPNVSLDYGVLEKSDNVYVMKCDFGWADLGTWHGIYEAMRKKEGDNVVIDSDVILEESANNVIKLPKGRLAVINGLDGYIVAEQDNVLFICKKEDSSALVRKYVNEVQMKKGEDFV